MTLLLFFRPKFYDPGGLNKGLLSKLALKREVVEEAPEVFSEEKPDILIEPLEEIKVKEVESNNLSEQLFYLQENIKLLELEASVMEKIKIQEKVLEDRRKELRELIESMKEEEEFLIMLLLKE